MVAAEIRDADNEYWDNKSNFSTSAADTIHLIQYQQVSWLKEATVIIPLNRNFHIIFIQNRILHHR
jgi:hypothetical protein